MDMPPRYSLSQRSRAGGRYDDEMMETESRYSKGGRGRDREFREARSPRAGSRPPPPSRSSGRSKVTSKEIQKKKVDSYSDSSSSESDDSSSDESSASASDDSHEDERIDIDDGVSEVSADSDREDFNEDFAEEHYDDGHDDDGGRYDDHNDDQFDNRSFASNGGQSIAAMSLARAINKTKNKGGSRLSMQANFAMQRRKKESPKLKAKMEATTNHDVDYNDGATELYKHIENHRWREAAERSRSEPFETKIWVYRMDKKNKHILWKMLPLHTAILYRAPVYVILDLIQANPDAPSQTDDRKMLPVHMACRVTCKEDVLRVLLKHKPDSVVAKDTKGRTPREIIMSDKSGDNESKVLKKVAARNKKNLLKVLKEFETIHERLTSAHSIAGSRWNRGDDDDDRSVSSRFSRRSFQGGGTVAVSRARSRSTSRPGSGSSLRSAVQRGGGGNDRSRSTSRSRPMSREDARSTARSRSTSRSRQMSREDARSTARSRSTSRTRGYDRPRSASMSPRNAQRLGRSPEDAINNRRSPRLPTGPPGRAPRAPSMSPRGRNDGDAMSMRSGRSRVPRMPRGGIDYMDDDDNQSAAHSRSSRISLAARGYDDDSVGTGRRSMRSNAIKRVRRQPRGLIEGETNPLGINEIKIGSDDVGNITDDDDDHSEVSGEVASQASKESVESLEVDVPDGPLYELWKDLEALHPVPDETFDQKVIQESEKKITAKRLAREEAISKMKYYDPPKELQKLLAVIKSGNSDATIKMNKGKKQARAPLPEKNTGRRLNACGALRALSKNAKNRLRLGRTKGVISCLLHVLRDEAATVEERARCSNTLMFLSVPKQNCEAIYLSDPTMLSSLLIGMNDEDSRVNYNCCYCLFLLSKSEENRLDIAHETGVMKTLVRYADIGVEDAEDDEFDDVSVDGSLSQRFANLGTPSGIRQQGDPSSGEETKRGLRLSAMKVFLAISKSKEGAHKMVSTRALMNLLTKISGTMTAEENILCMAIFTNLSRNVENMERLFRSPRLMETIARGLASKSKECRKCATLTLQNISCNKNFRRRIGPAEITLPGLASQSLNRDGKTAIESQLSAIHTMRNLSVEAFNVVPMMNTPGLTASLMMAASDKRHDVAQYTACDTLAAMSQWLDAIADTCIEKNEIKLNGRTLASMRVSTWNQWE